MPSLTLSSLKIAKQREKETNDLNDDDNSKISICPASQCVFVLSALHIISFNHYNTLRDTYQYYTHSTDEKLKLRGLSDIQGHSAPK